MTCPPAPQNGSRIRSRWVVFSRELRLEGVERGGGARKLGAGDTAAGGIEDVGLCRFKPGGGAWGGGLGLTLGNARPGGKVKPGGRVGAGTGARDTDGDGCVRPGGKAEPGGGSGVPSPDGRPIVCSGAAAGEWGEGRSTSSDGKFNPGGAGVADAEPGSADRGGSRWVMAVDLAAAGAAVSKGIMSRASNGDVRYACTDTHRHARCADTNSGVTENHDSLSRRIP